MGAKIKYTTEEYITLVKEKHENRYSYPNTIYKGHLKDIEVYCRTHGNFLITATSHLSGRGCQKCGYERYTKEEVLIKAKEIHGDKYDYSKAIFEKLDEKVIITCPIHGEFLQSFSTHVGKKAGCKKCGTLRGAELTKKKVSENMVNVFTEIHGDKYDYSKFIYNTSYTKGIIICKTHGEFLQTYSHHIEGAGCPKCGWQSHWRRSDYIKKANDRICTFYTIRCFNGEEEFYKIGITMNSTKSRYYGKVNLPYEYEVISEVKGSAGFIWDLERDEKRKLKSLHYKPELSFGGSETECFTNYKI